MAGENAETINAITANLIAIIEAQQWAFEDTTIDEGQEILPLARLTPGSINPEQNHGEGPMYIEQDYTLELVMQIADKATGNTKGAELSMTIEEAITVATLNVGDLVDSLLVSHREIDGNYIYEAQKLEVTANITVRFRDSRV